MFVTTPSVKREQNKLIKLIASLSQVLRQKFKGTIFLVFSKNRSFIHKDANLLMVVEIVGELIQALS